MNKITKKKKNILLVVSTLIMISCLITLTLKYRTLFSKTPVNTVDSTVKEIPNKAQTAPVELTTTSIKSKAFSSIKALTPLFVTRYSNYYSLKTVDLTSFQISLVQTKYPTCADPLPDLPKDWDFNKPIGTPLLVIFDKELHIIVGLYEFGDLSPTIALEEINQHPAVVISGIYTGCGPGSSFGSGGLYEENKKLYNLSKDMLVKNKVIHAIPHESVEVDRVISFTPVEDF